MLGVGLQHIQKHTKSQLHTDLKQLISSVKVVTPDKQSRFGYSYFDNDNRVTAHLYKLKRPVYRYKMETLL